MTVAAAKQGNKRRKLSPAVEDSPQRSKRKSHPNRNKKSDMPTNDGNAPISERAQDLQMPSVKGLDSSEPVIRRSTLKTILEHLRTRPSSAPLTSIQCLQLWRGFFVAIYMHDSRNALSVQNLVREIAQTFSLFVTKDDERNSGESRTMSSGSTEDDNTWLETYHTAFWETITREWATIDSHRMNKYLLLTRFVLRELFTICLKPIFEHSDTAIPSKSKSRNIKTATDNPIPDAQELLQKTRACANILETVGPLNPSQRKISDGLRLHVLDVWSDELFGALSDLEEAQKLEKESASGTEQRVAGNVSVLQLFQESVEKVAKSNSGAQRHVRLRAKDATKAVKEQMDERSWNKPV